MAREQKTLRPAGGAFTRSRANRARSEHVNHVTVAIVVAVLIAIGGLLGWGYYSQYVAPGQRAALEVGGHKVTLSYFSQRLRDYFLQNTVGITTAVNNVEAELEQEEILFIMAPKLGLTASDQEVKDLIAKRLGVDPKNPAAVDAAIRVELKSTGMSYDQYLSGYRAEVLLQKLRGKFTSELPKQTTQYHLTAALILNDSDVQKAEQMLKDGQPLATVAAQLSKDASASKGGDLGWVIPQEMDPAVADALPKAETGKVQGPVKGKLGQWFFLVTEKQDNRAVTADQQTKVVDQQVSDFFGKERVALGARNALDRSRMLWVVGQSLGPTAQQAIGTNPLATPPPGSTPNVITVTPTPATTPAPSATP